MRDIEQELIEAVAGFDKDPLGYIKFAYEWNEGELSGEAGPRAWQSEVLSSIGNHLNSDKRFQPLLVAVSSGHGIGKSALISQITMWGLSTCVDTKVVVTANTEAQLRTKTWPEIGKWHRLAINSHWFKFTATALYTSDPKHEKSWRADAVTWSENNTEAFAGLHNKKKRIIVIFDEASAISDKVWEVTEGALTDEDTEIIWIAFGNPTRNTGRFRQCFGNLRHRWINKQIDSRLVEGTNKEQISKWVEDYGEDSDFVRVRVRGVFPRASSLQFIPTDLVTQAMEREARCNVTDPLVLALDVARGGDDNCVFRFRRGLDARTLPPIRIPGSQVKDSMRLVSVAIDLLERHKPDAFFFDGTGVGGPVGDRIRQLGYPVFEVQFGAASPDPRYANMRAYIWARMREWLENGGAIHQDPILEQDLIGVEYSHNKKDALILEPKDKMKERGLASPDDGDALAMTFAFNIAPKIGPGSQRGTLKHDYDPFEKRD